MGQKVNPKNYRLIINRDWDGIWFSSNGAKYSQNVLLDYKIRNLIEKKTGIQAAVEKVTVSRTSDKTKITIHTGRPGVIIGRSGQGIENITSEIKKIIPGKVDVEILEIRKSDLSATLVAQSIGQQISRRVAYKRAVRMAIQKVMQAGAKGIKVTVSGRLNGAEIARSEKFNEGSIPLTTLRAKIDFAVYQAHTTYGTVGIKVWILKKEEVISEE